MYTQHNMLACRIDLYFLDYRLVIEIDENGHSNRNIDYELKRQKEIEQELDFVFIWTDPNKEDFVTFNAINEIFRYIKQSSNQLTKQSTTKTLTHKIWMTLFRLQFKSNNMIKTKAIKHVVKNIVWLWIRLSHFTSYKNNGNILRHL